MDSVGDRRIKTKSIARGPRSPQTGEREPIYFRKNPSPPLRQSLTFDERTGAKDRRTGPEERRTGKDRREKQIGRANYDPNLRLARGGDSRHLLDPFKVTMPLEEFRKLKKMPTDYHFNNDGTVTFIDRRQHQFEYKHDRRAQSSKGRRSTDK